MAEVLVVDDEDDIRELVAMCVQRAGHVARSFDDPRQALAYASSSRIDLALLDWSMPVMDGGELCSRMRTVAHLADIPILVVTAFTDEATRSRADEAGATGFIAKPFSLQVLMQYVAASLAAKDAESATPSDLPTAPA